MTTLWVVFLAQLYFFSISYAQRRERIVNSLSFGQDGQDSLDSTLFSGWSLSGQGFEPQVMSDRLILTPPYPGNCKGAMWAQEVVKALEWTVDLNFRATGPGRGGGNLQLWYTKNSQAHDEPESLYTVTDFDGLLIVVDQYGGRGGSIRGYLNDGTINYKEHHAVDTLAFGRCDYPYRNLGRLSNIRIIHNTDFFQVLIDGQECFRTDKISLPSNFFHGLSASTSEDPDSFEIHKFVLSANSSPAESSFEGRVPENSQRSAERAWDNSNKIVDGTLAAVRQISTQLDEMNTRIQSIDRMLNSVSSEITEMKKYGQGKASTMENGLRDIDGRIRSIEQVAKKIRAEVEGRDYKDTLANLQGSLKETQSNLLRSLPESISDVVTKSSPQMGYFISIIIASQLSIALTYVLYKRRRNSSSKKYL